jgi:hypothetical protein
MRDYITDLPHVCVDYCQCSDWGCRKRTRLWTNIPLTPRTCDGSCANMDGKRHRVNLINRGGNLHDKYRVPSQLIEELLGAVTSRAVDSPEKGGETSETKGGGGPRPSPAEDRRPTPGHVRPRAARKGELTGYSLSCVSEPLSQTQDSYQVGNASRLTKDEYALPKTKARQDEI